MFKGQNRETGQIYALKMTKIENASDGIPSTTLREIAILKELEHPCVVGLHDVVH